MQIIHSEDEDTSTTSARKKRRSTIKFIEKWRILEHDKLVMFPFVSRISFGF